MSVGSKKLFFCVSVCVSMCQQVVYVSVGSRKIVFLCVGVCQHVSAGCLCVDRFKKNWIVECRCVIGSKKLYCHVSMCVVVCRRVIYVSTGSRKTGLLSVGVCHHVSAGCLCVGRFKKNCVVVCRCVSVSEKNCVIVCQCVSSCVGRLFFCVDIC